MLGLVQSKVPLLELRGVRGLGRLTYKAPFFCPEPHRTVHATKVSVAQADGVPAIVGERCCGYLCTQPQHACFVETGHSAKLLACAFLHASCFGRQGSAPTGVPPTPLAWQALGIVSEPSLHQPGNT